MICTSYNCGCHYQPHLHYLLLQQNPDLISQFTCQYPRTVSVTQYQNDVTAWYRLTQTLME